MPKGPKDWSPLPRQAWDFEAAVRQAFVDVYGPPADLGVVEKSIRSSFLPEGKKLGWTEPRENVVLVLTEYAWVQEPYSSKYDHELWDKVETLLQAQGWSRASWDSVNAGVQVVYWRP
jgi:hypothetical protein